MRATDVLRGLRRWRPFDATRLVLVLAVVLGLAVVSTTFLTVWGWVRLNDVVTQKLPDSRYSSSLAACKAQAALARTANEQTRLYENLIVTGARGSRIFEPFFRQYGAQPYAVRIQQAISSAQKVENLLLPIPDCRRFAKLVRDNIPVKAIPSEPPRPRTRPPEGVCPKGVTCFAIR